MEYRKYIYEKWHSKIKQHLNAYDNDPYDEDASLKAYTFVTEEMEPYYVYDRIKNTPYSEEYDEYDVYWCDDDNKMRKQFLDFREFVYSWYESVNYSCSAKAGRLKCKCIFMA